MSAQTAGSNQIDLSKYQKLDGELFEKYNRKMVYVLSKNNHENIGLYRREDSDAFGSGDPYVYNERVDIPPFFNFTDKDGKSRVIRYKPTSQFLDQTPQIRIDDIGANERANPSERKALVVRNGKLEVNDAYTNWYLDADNCPARADFTGKDRNGYSVLIELIDVEKVNEEEYDYITLQTKAVSKVLEMDREQLRAIAVSIFGINYALPEGEKEARTVIAKGISGDEKKIKVVLDYQASSTGGVKVEIQGLINKAIEASAISFAIDKGAVLILGKDGFIPFKNIAADSISEQQELLVEFLASDGGSESKKLLEKTVSKPVKK
jgi:hypothetical protein